MPNLVKEIMALDLKTQWQKRPWWLNIIGLFCLFMTFLYSPFDLLWKPMAEDVDVWFGVMFHGWQARIGGVIHLLVYAALSWGIWHMRPWTWLLGSLYATQVVLAMFLWPIVNGNGGWMSGVIAGLLFSLPAIALWRSRALFEVSTT